MQDIFLNSISPDEDKNKVLKSKLFPNYAKRFRSLFVTLQPNLKNPIWT